MLCISIIHAGPVFVAVPVQLRPNTGLLAVRQLADQQRWLEAFADVGFRLDDGNKQPAGGGGQGPGGRAGGGAHDVGAENRMLAAQNLREVQELGDKAQEIEHGAADFMAAARELAKRRR